MCWTLGGNPDIRGIPVRGREFKLSLFADDIILTMTQPRISLPNLHAALDTYRSLLGYKINASKSEALTINMPAGEVHHLQTSSLITGRPRPLNIWGFTLHRHSPPYTKQTSPYFFVLYGNYYKNGSLTIYPTWGAWLRSWWPFSLNSYTYSKHCLFLSPRRTLQADLIRFVWNYKRHRIPRSVLMASRSDGGLVFPNLVKILASDPTARYNLLVPATIL